ncbi:hypothetical protein A1O7_08471 [Cladophialophora yegresii CBS 114405]|uniref:Sister chromatid cohesion protein Dcc1 n=1 Tax=Cladophialophora yegresii CBS 114405 TaxID=1182544 RepID=W9VJ73_9EURO|nr:uncharacterized protein A1O7_08471 [Cladophialophora yegresii CBS 114405]EXJ55543.1 hypothetical protein A1O7_08471 [Cladophialophora yegresii CBS 114405]
MASSLSSHFAPVPFSLTEPPQSFRLLELSPELVDIIETQRNVASKRRRLWFKASTRASYSAPTSSLRGSSQSIETRAGDADRAGFLHLCSEEKVWAVKQVSTSNSVHITQWVSAEDMQRQRQQRADQDGHEDDDMFMTEAEGQASGDGDGKGTDSSDADADRLADPASNGGITAIAQVKNILEIIEVKPSEGDVDRMLRQMVPSYGDAEDGDDQHVVTAGARGEGLSSDNRSGLSLQYIFENTPAPTKTIFEAMNRLFIFGISASPAEPAEEGAGHGQQQEQEQDRGVALFIPTTGLLLKCWRVFMQQCAISEVHLDGRAGAGVEYRDLHGLVDEIVELCRPQPNPEAELQTNVIVAILRHLSLDVGDYARYASTPSFHLPPDADLDALREELPSGQDDGDATNDATTTTTTRLTLDPIKTRDLVGRWLLHSLSVRGDTQSIGLAQFLMQWGDLLPESWTRERECDVHALLSGSGFPEPEWEIGKDATHGEEILRRVGRSRDDADASSATQADRVRVQSHTEARKRGKWHEKFGAQRNAALKK